MDQLLREEVQIELHPNNIKGVDDYYLSRSLKPLTCPLKGKTQHVISKNKTVILTRIITRYIEDHPLHRPT